MNFNKAIIVGRLTRDPESRAMPSGQNVVSLSVATNRVWKDSGGNKQEAVEYHNIVAFGKLADICSQYLNKGQLILIEGRIQTRSWDDKDGVKKYRTEIVADNMQMGPRRGEVQNRSESAPAQSDPKQSADQPAVAQEDIPIIEAEEPLSNEKEEPADTNADKTESASSAQDEVDVKNIPF